MNRLQWKLITMEVGQVRVIVKVRMKSNSSLRLSAQQVEIDCLPGKCRCRSIPFSSYWTNPAAVTSLKEAIKTIATMDLD